MVGSLIISMTREVNVACRFVRPPQTIITIMSVFVGGKVSSFFLSFFSFSDFWGMGWVRTSYQRPFDRLALP